MNFISPVLYFDIYVKIFEFIDDVPSLFLIRGSSKFFCDILDNFTSSFFTNVMLFLIHHQAWIKRDFKDGVGYIVSYQPGIKDVFNFGIVPQIDSNALTLGPLFHNKNSISLTKLFAYDVKLKSLYHDPRIPLGSVVINSNEHQQTIRNGRVYPDIIHHILLPHSFKSLYVPEPKMYIFLDPLMNRKIIITAPYCWCRLIFYQKNEMIVVLWNETAFLCKVDLCNHTIKIFETSLPIFMTLANLEHFSLIESLDENDLVLLETHQGPLYCFKTYETDKIVKGSIQVYNLLNDDTIFIAEI